MLRSLLCSAALSLLVVPASAQSPELASTRQVGTATLQNVPPVPAEIAEAVQRYQNSRAATFQDWLPDGGMLITTRFGATNQLHRVAAPGADRTQVTFYAEPVAGAVTIPASDRFVLTRDTGGDEWFQLYAKGLAGPAVQLTEAGTRNGSPVFSKDGSLLVWSRATKGSPEYTLLATDPRSAGTPRTLHKVAGNISPDDLSDDTSRLLFTRGVSNRESQLFILDMASGAATRVAPDAPTARYESARFGRGGQSIIAISDRDSDTRRLVEIDLATGNSP